MTDFILGYANDADAARGDVGLVTEDGIVLLVTPVGNASPGGGSAPTLIFPTIAALEAFNASTPNVLKQGQFAVVQSNNSAWELSVGTEGEVDHITVASVTAPPFANAVWTRWASTAAPTYVKQPGWHVNPATGNDEASGVDSAHPIKTKAEIFRRWGYTWSPTLFSNVVISYDASQTDDSDPGFFAPNFAKGAQLTHTAPTNAPSFTGTINALTAKSRAGNTALHATFNTTTGAMANGLKLVNTTRGNSIAWAFEGGPNFLLTQPCAPYAGGDATVVTEVDTWAPGDAIQGFAMNLVDLAVLGGTTPEYAAGNVPQHLVSNVEIVDFGGSQSNLEIYGEGNVAIVEAFVARSPVIHGSFDFTTFANSVVFGVILNEGKSPLNTSIRAGGFGSSGVLSSGFGPLFDQDVIMGGPPEGDALSFGDAYIDTGNAVFPTGGFAAVGGVLYGPGGPLNVLGPFSYVAPATTSLPLAGGIVINGSSQAYSNLTTAGSVATHRLAITPAALDAAAGAAGFGGLAYIPGVGALFSGATAP